MKAKILLLGLAGLFATILEGCGDSSPKSCNYYIDAVNGNDTNDGLSMDAAWKSLDKAKGVELNAGDSLLLCRGNKLLVRGYPVLMWWWMPMV